MLSDSPPEEMFSCTVLTTYRGQKLSGWGSDRGWKAHLEHIQAHPCSGQGQLQLVSHSHVQLHFEYLHRWRLNNLTGQPAPLFDYTHHRKAFLTFRWNFLSFEFVLSQDTNEKSLDPSSSDSQYSSSQIKSSNSFLNVGIYSFVLVISNS